MKSKSLLKPVLIGMIFGFVIGTPTDAYQTIPTISVAQAATCSIEWDQDAPGLVEANAFHYEAINDSQPAVTIPVTCTGTISPFSCLTPLPIKTAGTHTSTITAAEVLSDGTFATSVPSALFTYRVVNPPNAPKNLHIKKQ